MAGTVLSKQRTLDSLRVQLMAAQQAHQKAVDAHKKECDAHETRFKAWEGQVRTRFEKEVERARNGSGGISAYNWPDAPKCAAGPKDTEVQRFERLIRQVELVEGDTIVATRGVFDTLLEFV